MMLTYTMHKCSPFKDKKENDSWRIHL